jgi:hypothetical protein
MTRFVALAFLLAAVAGSGAANVLHGYVMSITIPYGWHGRITPRNHPQRRRSAP